MVTDRLAEIKALYCDRESDSFVLTNRRNPIWSLAEAVTDINWLVEELEAAYRGGVERSGTE